MSAPAFGWVGVSAGGAVVGVVAMLLHSTLRPVLEISRYAEDIGTAGNAIVGNLEPAVTQLGRTRELASALPALATAFLAGSQ